MTDFVHCNRCITTPKQTTSTFFITSCGHVYCKKCVDEGGAKPCTICTAPSPTAIEIGRNMKSSVARYFTDPAELSRRHAKIIATTTKFQKQQRCDYIDMLTKQMSLADKAIETQQKSLADFKSREREIVKHAQTQKEQLKQLTFKLKTIQTHTPMRQPPVSNMTFTNVSATPISGGGAGWQQIKASTRILSPFETRRHKSPAESSGSRRYKSPVSQFANISNGSRGSTPGAIHRSGKSRSSNRRSPYGDLAERTDRLSMKGTPEHRQSRRRSPHSAGSSTIRNLLRP